MTVEELWNNLKPLVEKVDNLEGIFDNLEGRFDNLEGEVNGLNTEFGGFKGMFNRLENKVDNLSLDVKEIKNEVREINNEVHKNNINITALLTGQEKIRQELAKRTEENSVEHKKFEYQIANLQWKSKIAN